MLVYRNLKNFTQNLEATKMVVLGIGNILLDVMVNIKKDTLIKKYGVQKDGHKELNDEEMEMLMKDISKFEAKSNAGGATQNTMRVLQWILNIPNSTFMIGAVGKDVQGKQLKKLVEKDGVKTHFVEIDNKPTGKAIALIMGATRTLIANIGASLEITKDHIKQNNDISEVLNQSKIFYMEGFFITERFETAKYFVDYSIDNRKAFVFNISAPYLCELYAEDMKYFAEKSDILFGNLNEFKALCKAYNMDSIDKLLEYLCVSYNNDKELEYDKIIVMTNGAKTVLCMHSKDKKEMINVPKIEKSKIVDTVGAGDAFVAGFLGALCFGKEPTSALKWGCSSAREIIQQSGCTIPKHLPDFLKDD